MTTQKTMPFDILKTTFSSMPPIFWVMLICIFLAGITLHILTFKAAIRIKRKEREAEQRQIEMAENLRKIAESRNN